MLDTNLNHFKSFFTYKIFIEPADRNYYLARFAKAHRMHEEFWWQVLQAVEKYLKAGLVLNNKGVRNFKGHDLAPIWKLHRETFDTLPLAELEKPSGLSPDFWRDRPLDELISRISAMGHPDSRYGLLSYSNHRDDLFKIDELAFQLRRRTIGLSWIIGRDWEDDSISDFNGKPYQLLLQEQPRLQIRPVKTPRGRPAAGAVDASDLWHLWNFSFLRHAQDIDQPAPSSIAPSFIEFGNSYLGMLLNELHAVEIDKEALEKLNWLVTSIRLGRNAEDQLKRLINTHAETYSAKTRPIGEVSNERWNSDE